MAVRSAFNASPHQAAIPPDIPLRLQELSRGQRAFHPMSGVRFEGRPYGA